VKALPPRTVGVVAIREAYDRYVRERLEAGETETRFIHVTDYMSAVGHRPYDAVYYDSRLTTASHWEGYEAVRERLIVPYCDGSRHLICRPYSVENLHRMARELGLRRCWFHANDIHPHYDIPLSRREEIEGRVRKVSSKELLRIIKGQI
jgi:hypothetical protein